MPRRGATVPAGRGRRACATLAAALSLACAVPALGDLEAGIEAYRRGDHARALEEFRRDAPHGYPTAQFGLGVLYDFGHGVDPDAEQAAHWYRLAAEQGHALAQYNLGSFYHEGRGVQRDLVQAFAWFDVAGANGDVKGWDMRERVRAELSEGELNRARELAWSYRSRFPARAVPTPSGRRERQR